jgi:hypothetical protein
MAKGLGPWPVGLALGGTEEHYGGQAARCVWLAPLGPDPLPK